MDGFFASIRRTGLVRSDERWIGGVSGGLALRMGIDPLIVRGLFGVSVLLGGLGLVLYGVGWLLLPEQRDGRIHLQQLIRGDFDAAVIGGFAAMLVGFAFPDRMFPFFGWGNDSSWWGGLIGLVAVVVIIGVIASAAARGRTTGTGPSGPATSLPRYSPTAYSPSAPVAPAAASRPEGPTMYPAPPAPGAPTGPAPASSGPQHGPATAPYGTAPYGPAPYGSQHGPQYGPQHGPQYGPAPYGPPRPMAPPPVRPPSGPQTALPPRPRATGPGSRAVGVVVALGLMVLAGLLYAERIDAFDHPVLLTTAAIVVVLCGVGIMVAGFFGRTAGGLGAIALLTILVLAPISAASDVSFDSTSTFVGDVRWTPTDVAEAEDGYSVFAGDVTLDLTDLPSHRGTIEVPVHLGAGDLQVILPEGSAYEARIQLLAGKLNWLDDPAISGVSGQGWGTFESPAVEAGETPDIKLEVSVGAGNLVVVEES
jgi:phage shock protein PspC (stress-responsive transcriptional regulator)